MGAGATGLAGNGMKRLSKYGTGATPSYLRASRKFDKDRKQKIAERKKARDMSRAKARRRKAKTVAKPSMLKRVFRRRT